MTLLFEAVDPRGYTVICTKECWKDHIVANRPFMDTDDWINEAKNAIEHPYMGIYEDSTHSNRNVYYGLHKGKTRYIKVIVDFKKGEIGYVITAYPDSNGREGERLI